MAELRDVRVVIVPPWEDAGNDHWMTHWQRKYSGIERVEQRDWYNPRVSEWIAALDECVSRGAKPVVLVAHSLGAATAVRWAESGGKVLAAFLVAPPDLEQENTPAEIAEFGPLAQSKLGFPSVLVASENDPYITVGRANFFAQMWGSELVNIGEAGHINPKSGFGEWQEGEKLLGDFISSLSVTDHAMCV